jgi:hypothetical protein
VPKTNKFKALEERKKVVVKGFLFDDVVHFLGEVKKLSSMWRSPFMSSIQLPSQILKMKKV